MKKQFLLVLAILVITNIVSAQALMDKSIAVKIGGIQQWINISAKDSSNPLLLFLGGGPGESNMDSKDFFTKKLQDHFTVVIWDQRESGKTLQLNASPEPLTVNLYQQDTHDLILYLLQRFHHKKLYLVGFSWGTVLGIKMAQQYPDEIYAYIAVSQLVYQQKSEGLLRERLKKQALTEKNRRLLKNWQVYISHSNLKMIYFTSENGYLLSVVTRYRSKK